MRVLLKIMILILTANVAMAAANQSCGDDIFAVSETELYIDPKTVTKDTLAEGTYFRYDPWYFDHVAEYINPQFIGIKADAMVKPRLTLTIKQGAQVFAVKKYDAEDRVYEALLANKKNRFQIFRLEKTLFEQTENYARKNLTITLTVHGQGNKHCESQFEVINEDPQHAH